MRPQGAVGSESVTILDEILAHKRREVDAAKQAVKPDEMAALARGVADAPRGFRARLVASAQPRVVAEIKRRSPSRGEIRADFDPVACAVAYAGAGAAAISVLTDEHYFGGHLEFLALVRRAVSLPLLRKDFVVDPYQVDESRASGADAVLLIAAAFGDQGGRDRLAALRRRALDLGLDALVEVHDERELEMALAAGADLIGINNRDLRSFEVDLGVTERLAAAAPEGAVLVAESGILTAGDLERLALAGADAFLVGEALMREEDIGLALRRLRRTL
ncbi:MAG: indole-3-glycerol phosphate synthase TrpC [Myxococcota bacterium]